MLRVRPVESGIRELGRTSEVGLLMRPAAEMLLVRAQAKRPEWLQALWFTKAGEGPRGSFAQAIARGDGAVIAEYGGRWTPPYAMFRSSI